MDKKIIIKLLNGKNIVPKKSDDKTERSWCDFFEKSAHKYIDPIMKKRFAIKYSGINSESYIKYISENICYSVWFVIPTFPMLFVEDGQQQHSKRIKSKEISPELVQLEKEYNKIISVGSHTRWFRECKDGKYDHYIDEGMKIIATYLKEKIDA